MPIPPNQIGHGDKASGRIGKNQLAFVGVIRADGSSIAIWLKDGLYPGQELACVEMSLTSGPQ